MKRMALAIVAGLATLWVSFEVAFNLRAARDAKLYPHDGQILMDAFVFAALVSTASAGIVVAAILSVGRSKR